MANSAVSHALVIAIHLKRSWKGAGSTDGSRESFVSGCLRLSESVPQRLRSRPQQTLITADRHKAGTLF
jgi:hypothetical protein